MIRPMPKVNIFCPFKELKCIRSLSLSLSPMHEYTWGDDVVIGLFPRARDTWISENKVAEVDYSRCSTLPEIANCL